MPLVGGDTFPSGREAGELDALKTVVAAGLHFPNPAMPEALGSGSHSGSQCCQPPGDVRRPRAMVIPVQRHIRPYQAISRYRWDAPEKRKSVQQ